MQLMQPKDESFLGAGLGVPGYQPIDLFPYIAYSFLLPIILMRVMRYLNVFHVLGLESD